MTTVRELRPSSYVELVPASDAAAWDAAVVDCGAFDTYHLSAYHRAVADQDDGEPHLLVVRAGADVAVVPFLVRDVDIARRDVVSAYGYAGPLASSRTDALQEAFARAMRDTFSSLGVVSAFLRLNPLIDTDWLFEPLAEVRTLGRTAAIDLGLGEAAMASFTNENHRRNLRSAEALRPHFVLDDSFEHLDVFIRHYDETMRRRGAAPTYFFPRAYFERLRAEMGSHVRLFHGVVGGEVVSSLLALDSGSIVQYHLGATTARPDLRRMSRWTIDRVRRWATEQGRDWLHLGGGVGADTEDSLFAFKASFATTYFPFRVVKMVIDPKAYDDLVVERAPWSLGDDTGWFPAYRSQPPASLG